VNETARMSPQVFSILSSLIEEKVGLHYDLSQLEILSERLGARAAEAGFDSLLDYYYYLRYDPDSDREVRLLAERLVVNETYFFRERPQLDLAVSDFIEQAVLRGERPRVWSAACASGEEILSLAMILAHRGILDRVDLIASDISLAALSRAKAGRFPKRSLRDALPAEGSPFLSTNDNQIVIDRRIVEAIEFVHLNLLDDTKIGALPLFDVIFCRNVLIYFRDSTVARTVDLLSTKLKPGGALFVGISESLMRLETKLVCEERRGVFFYRSLEC
jgi:chemotaxis protein methyltransferase CheR